MAWIFSIAWKLFFDIPCCRIFCLMAWIFSHTTWIWIDRTHACTHAGTRVCTYACTHTHTRMHQVNCLSIVPGKADIFSVSWSRILLTLILHLTLIWLLVHWIITLPEWNSDTEVELWGGQVKGFSAASCASFPPQISLLGFLCTVMHVMLVRATGFIERPMPVLWDWMVCLRCWAIDHYQCQVFPTICMSRWPKDSYQNVKIILKIHASALLNSCQTWGAGNFQCYFSCFALLLHGKTWKWHGKFLAWSMSFAICMGVVSSLS